MKNITLKSLFYDIVLVSIIIFLFIGFNLIVVICKMSDIGLWGILFCVIAWCVLGLPIVIRYVYVKMFVIIVRKLMQLLLIKVQVVL